MFCILQGKEGTAAFRHECLRWEGQAYDSKIESCDD